MRKVAEGYGYLYPYVPESLEAEIQCKQTQWVDAAIREYLKIPAHCDIRKLAPRHAGKYTNVLQTWDYGRHIYPNCVIIRRPKPADVQHYITTFGSSGKPVQLPDPRYYW